MDPLSALAGLGTVVSTLNGCIKLFKEVKSWVSEADRTHQDINGQVSGAASMLSGMNSFQPSMQDPFQGGAQWLPDLQQVAGQMGNSWVPNHTQGLQGVNLTGVWSPPMNLMDQSYIRQFGPYLNVIAGVGYQPTLFTEGMLNPENGSIFLIGQNVVGAQVTAQLQLLSNWTIQGTLNPPGPMGQPMQLPIHLVRVA